MHDRFGINRRNRWVETPGRYGVAQICLSGHMITGDYELQPQLRQDYCDKCGTETVYQCPSCETNIRGFYSDSITLAPYVVPSYCYKCGEPFPWTKDKLEAARALVDMEEGLSEDEKADLKENLDDLTKDTPLTQVAVEKWKRARPHITQGLWQLVLSLAPEAVKQLM